VAALLIEADLFFEHQIVGRLCLGQ
jgi:uncharacterized membrane protein YkvA (DUF1232 family)